MKTLQPPRHLLLLVLACLLHGCTAPTAHAQEAEPVRFTSVPDLFNWNIGNPQPGWEEALGWFFARLKDEGPDFTLNAGDIMDARWWDSSEQVREKTEEYWGGFNRRFEAHDITLYLAPGDHEYGDDGGLARGDIARAFAAELTRQMGMPTNGPEGHLGRAFYARHGELLVITLDTFEDAGPRFAYTVGEEQLEWMDGVLTEHADAAFVVVQGHLPIVGPVRSRNSSASMLVDGTDSAMWALMVEHGVDVYLAGEHHRITTTYRDGIWQIVHGALWGTQTDLNYMRGVVEDGTMTLELLEFDVEYSGGYIGDHPHRGERNRPRENVALTAETQEDGPRVTGTLVLTVDEDGEVQTTTADGRFERE
ncbi:metallophosphoesterase [Phycisphaeraceae bacterium D3-23]